LKPSRIRFLDRFLWLSVAFGHFAESLEPLKPLVAHQTTAETGLEITKTRPVEKAEAEAEAKEEL
jgi:hypothetical protein